MGAYIIRRLLMGVFIIWGVYTITFLAVDLAPGDPFSGKENAKIDEADLQRQRARWGYDLPVWQRYVRHLRNMVYRDPATEVSEGGGLEFTVRGDGDRNVVEARIQTPPERIVLEPTSTSRLNDRSETVTLDRQEDGTYTSRPMTHGVYYFGYEKLSAFTKPIELDSQGVLIQYVDGRVTARDAMSATPDRVVLSPREGADEAVTLEASGDGRYGPMPVSAGRYKDPVSGAEIQAPDAVMWQGGVSFNLGDSIEHNQPVTTYLAPRFWATLKLGFWALLVNYLVGISLGVVSAIRKDTKLDNSIMVSAFFLYSMPGFWLAIMLQLVFAVALGWLPIHGMGDGTFLSALQHYAMPVFVLGVAGAAGTARYQRSAMLEVLGEDYIRTARAKGVDEQKVIRKHALRNALLPIITLVGLSLPFLVSGAVITEKIFSWPGIGQAAIGAIQSRDVFVITAITLAATIMVVVGSLIADVLYAMVDPRVRLQ